MYHRPRRTKPLRVRKMKWNIAQRDVSFKKPYGGPQSYRSNFSTRVRSSIASPAKKNKGNGYNYSWNGRRGSAEGKHRWAARGSQRTKPGRSCWHPTPSPQPWRPTVQNQTGQDQDTPVQSVQDIASCQKLDYGAYIGNETRHLEFKRGGNCYLYKSFFKDAYKYGCAFLNSEGGSLLVGVCDNGMVCGVSFNHVKEDVTRQRVDAIAKHFDPPLFSHNYSLRFVPVIKPGELHLKVMCLTFRAPPAATEPNLYQDNKGEVYIKRDGSVQGPLSVSAIIECMRQKCARKLQQSEHRLARQVRELRKDHDQLRNIVASLWSRKRRSQVSASLPRLGTPDAESAHNTEAVALAWESPPPPEHS